MTKGYAVAKRREATKGHPGTQRDPEMAKVMTSMAVSGTFNGMAVIEPFQKNLAGKDVTADALIAELRVRLDKVRAGDMTHVESMLLSQATALQTIFASLARRAASQEYLKQYQTYLTLALKAQAQSRATLEALIELKHPRHPPTFVKQANIAHGPQQVNNGVMSAPKGFSDTSTHARTRPEEIPAAHNGLLEAEHERLDPGAQGAAGASNTQVETVGAIHRPDDR